MFFYFVQDEEGLAGEVCDFDYGKKIYESDKFGQVFVYHYLKDTYLSKEDVKKY